MPVTNRTSDLGTKGVRNIANDAVLPSTISIGSITSTQISYLSGVTSAIQTQLDTKATLSGAAFTGNVTTSNTSNVSFGSANGANFWRPLDTYSNSYLKIGTGSLYVDSASYVFRNTAGSSELFVIGSDGTVNGASSGTFTTVAAQGRGIGIRGGSGDTQGILQFVNNAITAQWASITSTNGVLNYNSSYSNFSGNVGIGITNPPFRLDVAGRIKLRGITDTAGIWYTNSSGTETTFGGLINDTTWGVFVSGDWRFSVSASTFYVTTTNTTIGGTGTNAFYMPYLAMKFNRLWDGYPGIEIENDTTWGPKDEFRIHGYGGPSGADFSINLRIDGGTYYTSDARVKTNISNVDKALDTVTKLQGIRYQRMNRSLEPETHGNVNNGVKFGFLAQDCIDIIPEAITKTENATVLENGWCDEYAVDYAQLTPLLVEAIKELSDKVTLLEGAL